MSSLHKCSLSEVDWGSRTALPKLKCRTRLSKVEKKVARAVGVVRDLEKDGSARYGTVTPKSKSRSVVGDTMP